MAAPQRSDHLRVSLSNYLVHDTFSFSAARASSPRLLASRPTASPQSAPTFSQVVVFGDSLSDDGNIRHRLEDDYDISYPGGDYNYSDGRFTNSSDTDPELRPLLPARGTSSSSATSSSFRTARSRTASTAAPTTPLAARPRPTARSSARSFPTPILSSAASSPSRSIISANRSTTISRATRPIPKRSISSGAAAMISSTIHSDDNVLDRGHERRRSSCKQLARRRRPHFLVPNVPPLGLIPHYKDDPETAAALNAASANYRDQFNTDLDAAVAALADEGITITLYRLDVYGLFYRLAANPEDYGFTNINDSAQGEDVEPGRISFLGRHPSRPRLDISRLRRRLSTLLTGTAQPPAQALNLSARLECRHRGQCAHRRPDRRPAPSRKK